MQLTSPIKSVRISGSPALELRGLIVVVGPNSSGKTQFLNDVNGAACGTARQLVVAESIFYNQPPPFEEYLQLLIDQKALVEVNLDHFEIRSFQYGSERANGGSFTKPQKMREYEIFSQAAHEVVSNPIPGQPFLQQFGPLSCTALFLKNRLSLMDSCEQFDHERQGPNKLVQALYWDENAKADLYSEIADVFQRAVWVDNTKANTLVVRVSDSPEMPEPTDRLKPSVMATYRTAEAEGDGLRSYSAIAATVLLQQRPLCLIDEPEMCLHPPQAYAMGRFIGQHSPDDLCTIVSTHSSHVLRGILETKQQMQIIRLTRSGKDFRASCLDPDLLEQAIVKPRSRSESMLEGLLSEAVILCESDGDRVVYEAVYRRLKDRSLDIRFIPSGGIGGFADPLSLYHKLEVPSAVIADIDLLTKEGDLKNILKGFGVPEDELREILTQTRRVIGQINSSLSTIDLNAVRSDLLALGGDEEIETQKLRARLNDISKKLSSSRVFQQNGIRSAGQYKSDLNEILSTLAAKGVFVVPVGELESWLPKLMNGISREDKSKWAMLAAEKLESVEVKDGDIWAFVQKTVDYLRQQLQKTGHTA